MRRLNLGGREVESVGLEADFWSDFAHRSLTVSWPVFFLGATLAFLSLNCVFATIYSLGDRPIANADGDFLHYLFFSIQTLTTVGYGGMYPQSIYGHVVASAELYTGVFTTALLTGLIFYRFSRPRARILFAERAVVTTHDGNRSLMLRAANERLNAISAPVAKVWLSTTIRTAEGETFRRFAELPLLRAQSPLFVLSWTIIHAIDETSPLFGMDAAALEAAEGSIVVMIEGYDESAAQTVRARKTYLSPEIAFDHRYVDVLEPGDSDRVRINYLKFHLTEPDT
ncbi:MAG TPA: ion channel [Rhodoblastus sp.]|nr:ion channel [Rhodoblastus sp.]